MTSFGFLFSVAPFYLDFTFRHILYLKILYYNIQCLGKSTKGSVWRLPPSSCLSSRPPAPLHRMSSWINLSASACCLASKKNSFHCQFCVSVTPFMTPTRFTSDFDSLSLSSSYNAPFQQRKLCRLQSLGHWIHPQFIDFVCFLFIISVWFEWIHETWKP